MLDLRTSHVARVRNESFFLMLLLLLSLFFFTRYAHLSLATDDVGWLRGQAPTIFDKYRMIPRAFFVSLNALFGPSPVAALVMIFLFHVANTLLLYSLCCRLMNSLIAARVAAFVFSINPITLTTLTWISCFSYVQGTFWALASLFAFSKSKRAEHYLPWLILALVCYGAGLLCLHELLFVPIIYVLFGWFWGGSSLRRGTALFGAAIIFGILVNTLVYNFSDYGVKTTRLLSLDFVSAYASSGLASGLSLCIAYPLSFFTQSMEFLRLCFSEPMRWGMTLMVVAIGTFLYKPSNSWRLWLVLVSCYVTLITPYILRLYLMPCGINYHLSYVLSGRVFYLAFTMIALILGKLAADLYEWRAYKIPWLLPVLSAVGYIYAFCITYNRCDFMGLQVIHGGSFNPGMPSWNPYTSGHWAWPLGSILIVIVMIALRVFAWSTLLRITNISLRQRF